MNFSFDFIPNPEESQDGRPSSPDKSQPTHGVEATKKTKRKLGGKKEKSYNWSAVEHQRYIKFLVKKGDLFGLNHLERKAIKINVMMSNAVHTRSSQQCHTHHQKMMGKYGSIEGIIRGERALVSLHEPKNPPIMEEERSEDQVETAKQEVSEAEVNLGHGIELSWSDYVGDFLDIGEGLLINW